MNNNELFLDYNKLPLPLSESVLCSYMEKMRQGDMNARDEIIVHYIRLVSEEVEMKFANTPYDKKDLVSIGIIGLLKAVDTFDIEKGCNFISYAKKSIINEIVTFLEQSRESIHGQSLYNPMLKDTIEDKSSDFVSEYETRIIYNEIRKVISALPDRDRKIILLYFGFVNHRPYSEEEIAKIMKVSQSTVSKIITRVVREIAKALQENGIIETVVMDEINIESNVASEDVTDSLVEKTKSTEDAIYNSLSLKRQSNN